MSHHMREGRGIVLPQNGSMILYNRKKVKYRKDGYCWKKRKDGKTTREDHMKLKVQGVEPEQHNTSSSSDHYYKAAVTLPKACIEFCEGKAEGRRNSIH
ncbi:calmodulin-binding transcription activator 1-like [Tachysurus ichikawai]